MKSFVDIFPQYLAHIRSLKQFCEIQLRILHPFSLKYKIRDRIAAAYIFVHVFLCNILVTCYVFHIFTFTSTFLHLHHKKVLVGDERLFTVTATENERMYVELARELIRLQF